MTDAPGGVPQGFVGRRAIWLLPLVVLLLNLVAVRALVFIWMERKLSGRIQDRVGPTRVGGKFGWLQTLADGRKLITKEDVMPSSADALLFKLAPAPLDPFLVEVVLEQVSVVEGLGGSSGRQEAACVARPPGALG